MLARYVCFQFTLEILRSPWSHCFFIELPFSLFEIVQTQMYPRIRSFKQWYFIGDSIKSQLPERCTYKKDEGHSNGYNVKWYFNVRNLRCEQMVYQGEGGNSNQFETLGECQTFCTRQYNLLN